MRKLLSLGVLAAPFVALALVGLQWAAEVPILLLAAGLIAAVLSAVHHAEVVAHRVGEPFGTLILALAVTVIELGLILTLMLAGGADAATLARDTVFAAVMIILNGLLGICLLMGGISHGEQLFRRTGASAALATLSALTVLSLVLPNYTISKIGPFYSAAQLGFVAIVSFLLYLTFVLVQTVRHRDYFLPEAAETLGPDAHAAPPSNAAAFTSAGLLLLCLIAVVLLAKGLAPAIEQAVVSAGAPRAVIGVVIAALVLLPESIAAGRAAMANRLQTSLNLALGSALATIGLTIPGVAALSITLSLPVALGLDAKSTVLLFLTLLVATSTLSTGRTTVLQGAVHLMIFAVYLFTTVVP